MAVQQVIDYTTQFNAASVLSIDIGGWDYVVVQLISPSGAINFLHTNDSNAIQGVTDGSAVSATNAIAVQGVNLATGAAITSLNAGGLVKFNGIGRYLVLSSNSVTVSNLLIRFYKIN